MNRRDVVCLQRLLSGELDAQQARELHDRMAVDVELRLAYESLAGTWSELDLPDPAAPPVGFAERVSRAAAASRSQHVRWSMAPLWAQTAAAFALAGGIVLGLSLAGSFGSADQTFSPGSVVIDGAIEAETTLGESYWQLLDETASESLLVGDSQ